jgi:hypothetical protein
LKSTSSPVYILIAALLPPIEDSPAESLGFPPERSNLMYGMYPYERPIAVKGRLCEKDWLIMVIYKAEQTIHPTLVGKRGRRRPARSLTGFDFAFDAILIVLGVCLLGSSMIEVFRERPELWSSGCLLFINGVLSGLGFMLAVRKGRPLFVTVFYFDFIFFSVGPLQQIQIMEDPIYAETNLVNFAILLCVAFSVTGLTFLFFNRLPIYSQKRIRKFLSRSIDTDHFQPGVLFFTSAGLSTALLYIFMPALFVSRDAVDHLWEVNFTKSISVLFFSYLNPLSVISAIVGLIAARHARSPPWTVAFSLCLLVALLINNPVNTARFKVAILTVLMFMLYFGWRNTRALASYLIFGTFVSAALNVFRYDVPSDDYVESLQVGQRFFVSFVSMDYHILNLICYTIKYTDNYGYSFGANILSYFLFFIPRPLWEGKSDNIGVYLLPFIKQYRYYGTDNLSSPLVSEGYFAFGLIGAILLPAMAFFALSFIERRAVAAEYLSPWHFMICASPMLTMILMRGPLIVGYSEFWGTFAAILTSVLLLRLRM